MRLKEYSLSARLVCGVAFFAAPCLLISQTARPATETARASTQALPDAPTPQMDVAAAAEPPDPQQAQDRASEPQQPATNPTAAQSSSSSQTPAPQPAAQETQHQKAEEQIKQQEQQRVAGIVPSFNVSYVPNAVSMSPGEKIRLAFRSVIDPFTFAAAFMVAGYHEVNDDYPGFGWGAEGYFKRSGAAYLDSFDGGMIGNGFLPAILHQDPRYFRMGPSHGITKRILYSAMTSYVCKHDNTGKWEPNYSNVGGNIISGAISNLYYPSQNSGWGQTITNGFIVTTEGTIGAEFQEFWPDISRRFLHRDPTHGLDAQARAKYEAQKEAKKQAKEDQKEQK